jgi:hypothetical protein
MTKFNPAETWKTLYPALEAGEAHPRCVPSASTV